MCIRDRPWSPPTDRRRSVSPAGQVLLVVGVLAVLHVPLGNYLARVYTASAHGRMEMLIFRLGRIDPDADQRWPVYLTSLLAFSAVGVGALYLLLRLQEHLPYSLGHPGMSPALAFDTAVSFASRYHWRCSAGWPCSPAVSCKTWDRRTAPPGWPGSGSR